DPWKAFYGKQRLGVKTYDLFNFVIGVNRGDIFKTFSIGGGIAEAEAYREMQLEPRKAKRFKAVSMFKGPFFTNSDGHAEVEFEMPEYIGAVRVMVVSAHGKSYANAEKTVPVKTDLMVMPSLPRVLGPGDKIYTPVTVFAMREGLGQVEVSIKTEGLLTVAGTAKKTITFTTTGEKDVYFQLQANDAIGVGKIEINAQAGNYRARYETEIDVRASSPRISAVEQTEAEPGQKVKLTIPNRGLPGSNEARISVQRLPHLDFTHRLYYLIRYPYGCIEQVVSSVFPQLYLKTLLKDSRKPKETEWEIDRNINFAIRRLRNFQLSNGAFTYWPGNREPSPWGTNYACHFLVEAQKLGYNVPGDLMQKWLRYQRSQALSTRENLMVRVYRVYILALAGKAHMGAMNLLKQNSLKDMTDTEKWMLAGAYQLAGAEDVASDILKNTGMDVRDYFEFGRTYGSTLRDKAIILEQLILFKKWDKANELAGELAEALSSDT
ncbi:MAG: alpha-2-macroglobulin family protein, partial [Calditrichia bacterium]